MTRGPMLCPNCRRLVGGDETVCSWCGTRRPTTRFGAAWRRGANADWWITAILSANIAFYLLSLIVGTGRGMSGNPLRILSPDSTSLLLLGATGTIPIDQFGRFWTLITANYLHGSLLHIFFNMIALRQIAPMVSLEFGASRMFVIYTTGGICGFIVSYLAGVPFTIGASAAVCGLIGALLYFGRSRGGAYGSMVFREVSGWVVGLVLFGLVMPGINNWGHGGGIVGGALFGMLLGYEERRREGSMDRFMAMAWGVITAIALLWAVLGALNIGPVGKQAARHLRDLL